MPYSQGYSGNPDGKQKGDTRQIPQYVKQTISEVLQKRSHLIVSKLDQIKDPVKYLELMYKLTGFVLSKSPQPEQPSRVAQMTEEELRKLYEEVLLKEGYEFVPIDSAASTEGGGGTRSQDGG
jgi:hypothetical protein